MKELVNQARANDVGPADLVLFAKENARDLLGHFPKTWPTDLSKELLQAIGTAMPALVKQAQVGGKKNTATYVGLLQSVEKAVGRGEASWSDWVKLSKTLPEVSLKPIAEPVNTIAARVAAHPGLQSDIAEYLERIFGLCARALNIYSEQKRELGVLDFTDQEHLLLKLFEQEDVAGVLRAEIDLLLVDEFQDTSPIQLALFLKLASFAKRVFWVGDVKQAIYGFRGSDTLLMLAILEALPGWGGTKEILGDSWRSRPPLVKLVNAVFVPAFSGSMNREEVELEPKRNDSLAGPVLANWILGGGNKAEEHMALVCGVRRLVESGYQVFDKDAGSIRPIRFGDIAILSRSHDGVTGIAQSLQEITQAVFIILARKARSLGRKTVLSGWLYRTTRLTATNFQRAELRRSRREQEAFMQSTLEETQTGNAWCELAPLLDNAMARLGSADRDAVVLRYFENKSLQEVGKALVYCLANNFTY